MLSSLPLSANLAIFVAAAVVVWIAGTRLADTTDTLSRRFGLGEALGGAILLAVATNLPEIAVTFSAAAANNLELAIGNILGGIAIQTVVLAAIDGFGTRGKPPLTTLAASPALTSEALGVVAVLTVTIMATQLPSTLIAARVTPGVLGIVMVWIAALWLVRRAGAQAASDAIRPPRRASAPDEMTTGRAVALFAVAALATLVAGVALERTSDSIATAIGMNGALFGATVLAAATALPELSTGLRSARDGSYELAASDIFGGNAFLPVLFLLATLVSGQAALPGAQPTDIYLTALAMLLTCAYLAGLVLRPRRKIAGMGVDSLAVLVIYAVGIALLTTVSRASS